MSLSAIIDVVVVQDKHDVCSAQPTWPVNDFICSVTVEGGLDLDPKYKTASFSQCDFAFCVDVHRHNLQFEKYV